MNHRDWLDGAVTALHTREAWSPFIESPGRRHHPDGAHAAGKAAFEARLNTAFEPGSGLRVGAEVSPFTGERLGISYPRPAVKPLFDRIDAAWPSWRAAPPEARVEVCLGMLARWHDATFCNAYATQHTAGQPFMLAFAGSGASALDRGLEALAAAWTAMDGMPRAATYSRDFGGRTATLHKRYRLVPVGVAVVFACGSYPAWNAYPAILANLATGNPVVLKPHPDTILPMAIAVQQARQVLADAGFDPDLLTLAPDAWDDPIGEALLDHPATRIVDFTGGARFGSHLERRWSHLQVYTETAGCNAVVLDSAPDLDAALDAIAHGLCLFSAQMCTAPQNLWIPPMVGDGDRQVPRAEVEARLVAAIDAHLADPARAAAVCGAVHTPATLEAQHRLRDGELLRAGGPFAHPDFPHARTATPLLRALSADDRALAQEEQFGPIGFVIRAESRDACLAGAAHDARQFGAIASYAYTADPEWQPVVEAAFWDAGASVGLNLVRQRPMNFTAAFSDYHVTGLNPAGTACLTDPAFVARRFRVVQSKTEV
ncbi:MAG: phenylacetic acid degradation protein paaN [Myxococcota bacterium]|jgi:phenylacetic acid degradation protein paaN